MSRLNRRYIPGTFEAAQVTEKADAQLNTKKYVDCSEQFWRTFVSKSY